MIALKSSPPRRPRKSPPIRKAANGSCLEGLGADQILRHYRPWFALGVAGVKVSHEFRNLLMSLMGNVSLLRDDLKGIPSSEGCLADIDLALKRAIDLATALQNVAQKRFAEIVPMDLAGCIREALAQLQPPSQPALAIRLELAPRLPPVQADRFLACLMLMELLGEAHRTADEILPPQQKRPAFVLHLQTELLANASAEGFPDGKPRGVLHARGEGFCPWSAPASAALPAGHNSTHLAAAMGRILMKLFQGEARVSSLPPHGERASFYFLIERPPAAPILPD